MNPPSIDALVNGIHRSFGSYGPVLDEIEEALNDPQGSLATVADAIAQDPDFTARLLRLGNSAYYGFPRRLTTVTETISLIGLQQVQDLISASSIVDTFAGLSPAAVNMGSFWQHSLACGIGARALAQARREPKPDSYFVAGLLHDVGRLVLFSQAPKMAKEVFLAYGQERLLLREAEVKVLGYDHAQIGEALLRLWQLPANLVYAVARHHQPASGEVFRTEAAIVHVADHMMNALQTGSSGERFVPPLNMAAWEELRLPREALGSVVTAIDEQFEAVQEAFRI